VKRDEEEEGKEEEEAGSHLPDHVKDSLLGSGHSLLHGGRGDGGKVSLELGNGGINLGLILGEEWMHDTLVDVHRALRKGVDAR